SYKDTSPFTDVPSWAEPYVAACWTNGITAGYSDTIYGGSDTVTTAQAALMLMKALGYFQYASDFGSDWQLATTRQGNAIDLFVGVDSGVTQAMTRNDVAQLVLNTLRAGTVEASTDGSWSIGDVTINNNVTYSFITSNQTYATAIDDARSTSNNSDAQRSIVELGEQLYMGDLKLNDNTTDVFGRPSRYWEYEGNEIGTYTKTELLRQEYTAEVTGRDLYDLLGKSIIDDYSFDIYVDGETEESVLGDAYFTKANLTRSNDDAVGETGNGVLTQVYQDIDTHEITIAVINTYLAQAEEDYDEKNEEVDLTVYHVQDKGSSRNAIFVKNGDEKKGDTTVAYTVESDEFDIAEVAENDLFLVTMADGAIQSMVAPEILSDSTITNFRLNKYVTADGTQYNYADTVQYDEDVLDKYDDANMKDITYNVILDEYGYMIGIEQNEDPDQYVFLAGIDRANSNLSVKNADANIIMLDGTMQTVTVNMTKSDLKNALEAVKNGDRNMSQLNTWCTYTVNSSNVYTLEEVAVSGSTSAIDKDKDIDVAQYAQNVGNDSVSIDKGHVSLKAADRTSYVYGNDDTVYLNVELDNVQVKDDKTDPHRWIIDDVESVTTGVKNVNLGIENLTNEPVDGVTYYAPEAEIYTLYNDDGYVIAAVTIGENEGTSSNYVYVTSDEINREADNDGDDWTWTREVVINGEIVEISEVGETLDLIGAAATKGNMEQGQWYEVKFDADGNVRKVEALNAKLINSDIKDGFIDEVVDVEDAVEAKDTVVLADTKNVEKLTFKNGTLYTDRNATEGFSVSPDVKVVLALAGKNGDGAGKDWFDDVSDGYNGYSGLEKALRDMNSQGTFKAGTVEVSAILENDVATSIVINDKNAPSTGVQNPSIAEGEFAPAMWNGTEIELRYYQTPMTDSEIKAAISEILDGEPVERLNKYMGYVVMENGDMYKVDFDQIEVVAIKLDGEIVAYKDKGVSGINSVISGLEEDTLISNGLVTADYTHKADADGKITVKSTLNNDLDLYTVYQVTDNTSGTQASMKLDDGKTDVDTGDYVAAGETVVVTFKAAGDYQIEVGNDVIDAIDATTTDSYEVEVTGTITIKDVSNYQTANEISSVVDSVIADGDTKSATNATIKRSGDVLNVEIANGHDITDVSGTGLMTLAGTLIAKGNTITVEFANGEKQVIDTKAVATPADVKNQLVAAIDRNGIPTEVTITVTNDASSDYVDYTVNIFKAEA
ncbi:S-layer homology domain-containing protein, partial [Dialister succinatiphilus]|uniref:S-layer homology domain-containing protein n=1 Tax=Dialister succinatiphilus TaxID=487173 RepID=UPI00307B0DB0